ncbi:MAG: hypothetical protein Q8K75_04570 [Chlamydiales bacterium]|nr:hypothetical protein [Chlamydiales bacterium]
MNKTATWADVKLAAMRALLHRVTPNLRNVCLDLADQTVPIVFCYDGPIGELENRLVNETVSQMIAELPGVQIKHEVVRIDTPEWRPQELTSVYARCEMEL